MHYSFCANESLEGGWEGNDSLSHGFQYQHLGCDNAEQVKRHGPHKHEPEDEVLEVARQIVDQQRHRIKEEAYYEDRRHLEQMHMAQVNLAQEPNYGHRRDVSIPKGLSFDGKSSWKSFESKFRMFMGEHPQLPMSRVLFLFSMTLSGKAEEYFSRLFERYRNIWLDGNMNMVLDTMAQRFDDRELSQAALQQFSHLSQEDGETVVDWADRVIKVAYQAFQQLPGGEVERLMINRFAVGLLDKEASRFIQCQQPTSMTQAMECFKIFTCSSTQLRPKRREDHRYGHVRVALPQPAQESLDYVQQTQPKITDPNAQARLLYGATSSGKFEEKLDQLLDSKRRTEDKMVEMVSSQNALINVMRQLVDKLSMGSQGPSRSRTPSPGGRFRRDSGSGNCFHCNEPGHFKVNCPRLHDAHDPNA